MVLVEKPFDDGSTTEVGSSFRFRHRAVMVSDGSERFVLAINGRALAVSAKVFLMLSVKKSLDIS